MAAMTLAEVETKINALLATPQVDYTIAEKTFKSSQKIQQLIAYRKQLLEYPAASQVFVDMNLGTNEFGQELGEFED